VEAALMRPWETTMHKIFGWSAKRSGATMTIKGRGEDNKPIKITDVVTIDASSVPIVATTGNGASYNLVEPR
jgi:hypothetical protein